GFSVCIHDGFVVFENLRQIHEQFLFYFLERIETCWRRHGQPGTQINLNSDIVAQEKIPLPSLAEQREIVGCLSSLDDLIEAREGQVAALKLYKRGLMQKLFPAPGDTAPVLRRAERITEAAT
ncbi:MAG: restriction endonuclease subunit S, partial [Hyphomonadaceae bacterium]|nr:restriction endonuclease subunit S [Hyphomonadaceae bacterium]